MITDMKTADQQQHPDQQRVPRQPARSGNMRANAQNRQAAMPQSIAMRQNFCVASGRVRRLRDCSQRSCRETRGQREDRHLDRRSEFVVEAQDRQRRGQHGEQQPDPEATTEPPGYGGVIWNIGTTTPATRRQQRQRPGAEGPVGMNLRQLDQWRRPVTTQPARQRGPAVPR